MAVCAEGAGVGRVGYPGGGPPRASLPELHRGVGGPVGG
jgi:hypothetical protein